VYYDHITIERSTVRMMLTVMKSFTEKFMLAKIWCRYSDANLLLCRFCDRKGYFCKLQYLQSIHWTKVFRVRNVVRAETTRKVRMQYDCFGILRKRKFTFRNLKYFSICDLNSLETLSFGLFTYLFIKTCGRFRESAFIRPIRII